MTVELLFEQLVLDNAITLVNFEGKMLFAVLGGDVLAELKVKATKISLKFEISYQIYFIHSLVL